MVGVWRWAELREGRGQPRKAAAAGAQQQRAATGRTHRTCCSDELLGWMVRREVVGESERAPCCRARPPFVGPSHHLTWFSRTREKMGGPLATSVRRGGGAEREPSSVHRPSASPAETLHGESCRSACARREPAPRAGQEMWEQATRRARSGPSATRRCRSGELRWPVGGKASSPGTLDLPSQPSPSPPSQSCRRLPTSAPAPCSTSAARSRSSLAAAAASG